MTTDEAKTLAVAIAAANGHPSPHEWADLVAQHLVNPPAPPAAPEPPAA